MVPDGCCWQDGTGLLASGSDAVVYKWDVRSQRCLSRFRNEGGTVTSSLAVGSRR
jgi:U3 small nucleolar RNA-associated protein 18